MRRTSLLLLVFLSPALMMGCGGNEARLKVAKNFWSALQENDVEKARSYATTESASSLNTNKQKEDGEFEVSFGKITEKDGQTQIETTLRKMEKGSSVDIPMQTILVQENGDWKVDVNLTMMSMFGGAMGAMMNSLKESMEKMGEAMSEQMKKSFE